MKRFSITAHIKAGNRDIMVEDTDGEWVKISDIKEALAELEKRSTQRLSADRRILQRL